MKNNRPRNAASNMKTKIDFIKLVKYLDCEQVHDLFKLYATKLHQRICKNKHQIQNQRKVKRNKKKKLINHSRKTFQKEKIVETGIDFKTAAHKPCIII